MLQVVAAQAKPAPASWIDQHQPAGTISRR